MCGAGLASRPRSGISANGAICPAQYSISPKGHLVFGFPAQCVFATPCVLPRCRQQFLVTRSTWSPTGQC
eukprot:4480402-Lingulodinium_polyedra.AAC.1